MARSKHFEAQLGGMSESEKESLVAGLTPEELAGLEGGDDMDDESIMFDPKAPNKTVSADTDDDNNEELEPEPKPEPKPKKKPKEEAKKPDPEPEDDEEDPEAGDLGDLPDDEDDGADHKPGDDVDAEDGEDEDEDEDPTEGLELIVLDGWRPPANAAAERQQIQDEIEQLAQQFDAGDLTATEYERKNRALLQRDAGIVKMVQDANTNLKINEAEWYKVCRQFLKDNPSFAGAAVMPELDKEVKRLQAESGNLFDVQNLITARNNLIERAAAITGMKPPKKGKPAEVEKKAEKRKVAKRGDAPPTLSGKPVSDKMETSNGEHEALNRMSTEDREKAMQRMSPEALDRYLAST